MPFQSLSMHTHTQLPVMFWFRFCTYPKRPLVRFIWSSFYSLISFLSRSLFLSLSLDDLFLIPNRLFSGWISLAESLLLVLFIRTNCRRRRVSFLHFRPLCFMTSKWCVVIWLVGRMALKITSQTKRRRVSTLQWKHFCLNSFFLFGRHFVSYL